MVLINRVREIRKNKGYSQNKLAKKAKITRPYLSDIERNISQPGIIVALNIAKALEEQVEKIFFVNSVQHEEHEEYLA